MSQVFDFEIRINKKKTNQNDRKNNKKYIFEVCWNAAGDKVGASASDGSVSIMKFSKGVNVCVRERKHSE